MASHPYSLRSRFNTQTPSLRTTPTGSPVIPKLGTASPRKPRSSDITLQLHKVIGTTTSSPSGLACCAATETYAYCAGAVAVLAKIHSDDVPSHRYYKARPTVSSIHPPTAHYEGSPAGTPSKRRTTTFISQRSQDDHSSGSLGREWLEESAGQTWTARERIKSTSCVALSADGRWLAVGESGYSPRVLLYSTADDASCEIPTSIVTDHTYGVRCISFSADMRYLATLGNLNDGFLFVWSLNPKTGQLSLHSANKCTANICDMTWCGNSLITVGTRHIKIWQAKDPLKQSPTRKSRYRPSEIYPCSPGPAPLQGRNCLLGSMVDTTFTCVTAVDDKLLVLGTETGHLCSVDVSRGTLELQILKQTNFPITSIAYLAVIDQIIIGTSHGLYFEDLQSLQKEKHEPSSGTPHRRLSRPSSIRRSLGLVQQTGKSVMAIGILHNHTVTLDNDGSLQIQKRESEDHDPYQPTFAAHNSVLQGVQAIPATSHLGRFFTWSKNGEVKFWTADGVLLHQRQLDIDESGVDGEDCQNELSRIRHWPARGRFIAGDRFGVLKLIKDEDWQVMQTMRAHSSEITCIAVSDHGSLVATCSRDRTVQLFGVDGDSLELLQTMDDHVGSVNQVLFSQSGEKLFSCSADRSLIIRERVLREQDGSQAVAFLSTKVLTLKSAPLSMTISATNVLAVATMDRRITKIDHSAGAVMDSFKVGDSESDDTVSLNSIIYSPLPESTDSVHGLLIGYCSMDKSIRVYNERNLGLLGRESGHTEGVSDIALLEPSEALPGSHLTIVSTGLDGTIMMWRIAKTTSLAWAQNGSPDRAQAYGHFTDENEGANTKPSPASLPPLRKVLTKLDIAELNRGNAGSPMTPRSSSPTRLKRKTSRLALTTTMEAVEESPSNVADGFAAIDNLAVAEKSSALRSPSPASRVVSRPRKQSSRTELNRDTTEPRKIRSLTRSPSPPRSMPTTPKQRQKSNNSRLRRPPSVPTDLRSHGAVSGRRQSMSQTSDFGSLGMATEQAGRMLRMYRKRLVHSREAVDLDDLEDEVCGLLKIIRGRKDRMQPAQGEFLTEHEKRESPDADRRGKAKAATESEVDQLAGLLADYRPSGEPEDMTSPQPLSNSQNANGNANANASETENETRRTTDLHYLSQALDLARLSPPKPTNFRVGCVIVASPTTDITTPSVSGGASEPNRGRDSASQPQVQVLATGYTLELPGNTHAEQNALAKLAAQHHLPESRVHECPELSDPRLTVTLYTTLEPCAKRLSGSLPCVERILATRRRKEEGESGSGSTADTAAGVTITTATLQGVQRVVYGAKEPDTFVQKSVATQILERAGVQVDYVGDLEQEILSVAMEGHGKKDTAAPSNTVQENPQSLSQDGQAQSQPGSQIQGEASDQSSGHHTGTNIDDISPEERRRQEALPRNPKKRMMEVNVPPR